MAALHEVGIIIYFAFVLVVSYCTLVSGVLFKWVNLSAQITQVLDVFCQKANLICEWGRCNVPKG